MMMSIRDLYNMITILPEAGLEYLVNRMVPPNQLTKHEADTLTEWISKKEKVDRTPILRQILLAINHSNIQYIANPTEDECLKAIYEDPGLIGFIDDPTETVQMAAAKHGTLTAGQVFKKIKNPARGMWKLIFEEQPDQILNSNTVDIEYQLIAIRKKPSLILDRRVEWSIDARREAFTLDPQYFPQLQNPTEDEIWRALEFNPRFLEHIEKPSQEMKAYCIFVA